jgi:hypothetical protein
MNYDDPWWSDKYKDYLDLHPKKEKEKEKVERERELELKIFENLKKQLDYAQIISVTKEKPKSLKKEIIELLEKYDHCTVKELLVLLKLEE